MKKIVTLCALALLVVVPVNGQTADFSGSYTVDGSNFNGSQYTGTATILAVADQVYRVEWNINGEQFSGIGFKDGSKLVVGGLDFPLVVSYAVDGAGNLNGTWLIPGAPATSTEKLTRVQAVVGAVLVARSL